MTLSLSNRMNTLVPSAIIQIATKARTLKLNGHDVLSLSIGVPGFVPPASVHIAAQNAIDGDKGDYLPGRGSAVLIRAFQEWMAGKGFYYAENEVCAQPGGKGALFNLMLAMVNPGDGIALPAPYWASYPEMIRIAGGVPVIIGADASQNYKITPQQLEHALEGAKGFIFNNPSNPTGMVYSMNELEKLAEVLSRWDGWIISDDIYDQLLFGEADSPHPNGANRAAHLLDVAPELRERMVIVQSVSKTFGMPGWRIGFAAGPEKMITALVNLASQSFTNLPDASMAAAAKALSLDPTFLQEQIIRLKTQRDMTMAALARMGLPCPLPMGAFYAFPQIASLFGKTSPRGTRIDDDMAFCNALLEEQGVAVVPGGAFGDGGAIRISYAGAEDELIEALSRMERFVGGLK